MKAGQIQQKRGIYPTQDFGHKKVFDTGDMFIGELLITSECRTLIFSDSETVMDGSNMKIS